MPVASLIVAIWAIELVNQLIGHRLIAWFGLEPRQLTGLIGIPAMPFLHGGLAHAAANTVPLGILGSLLLLVAPRTFWPASLFIVAASGAAVWMVARDGIVVGASGLLFGWFGFLLAFGVIERSVRAAVGTVLVLLIYGGMIWSVLPQADVMISWESHLFGAAAGILAAYLLSARGAERRRDRVAAERRPIR